MGGRVNMVCHFCKEPYTTYRSQVEHRGSKYCSTKCKNEGNRKIASRRCVLCLEEYVPKNHRRRASEFCSRGCWRDALVIEAEIIRVSSLRDCLVCGEPFSPTATQRRNGYGWYCSMACWQSRGTSQLETDCVSAAEGLLGQLAQRQSPVGRFFVDAIFEGDIALEVNGCYWHSHGCELDRSNGTRRGRRNRDVQLEEECRKSGVRLATVWECEFKRHGAESVREALRAVMAH